MAVISRHSERQAALPRRWKRSARRLYLVCAKTGSIDRLSLPVERVAGLAFEDAAHERVEAPSRRAWVPLRLSASGGPASGCPG